MVISFEQGELVFLKLQPYKQQSIATRTNEKLAWRYYSPYKVAKGVGNIAYRLEQLGACLIQRFSFLASQLKKAPGANSPSAISPPITSQHNHYIIGYLLAKTFQKVNCR